jgi:formate hydrogenlyase subunit 3/multisubunit Na+/H+ antiporter MnhD subunit
MSLLLLSIALIAVSGLPSLTGKDRGARLSSALAIAASMLGLVVAVSFLLSSAEVAMDLPWSIPFGAFSIRIDPLSAFFLIPIFMLIALTSLYGDAYMRGHGSDGAGRSPIFFGLLGASMAIVVLARNGMLFLIAWELMALASFFLVIHDEKNARARHAGIIYLIAMHTGTAFLLALFAYIAAHTGSMDFDVWRDVAPMPLHAGALFLMALIGFGTKVGLMPMHVWLPEAHPAAPSHVSALMSGVMIKTGIYGFLRLLTCLGAPPEWWGYVVIAIGMVSGIMGVLYALAQHELKSLLAFSSVENMGIIALGIGLGLLGLSRELPAVAVLGFGGALLHVLNHSLFKGLLFLGAGSVIRAAGSGNMDALGGLMKRMPFTGASFLTGSVAISGLPPLNGFISEFLIYMSAFALLFEPRMTIFGALPALAVIGALALIGGLAAACFAKAFGTIFLGEARKGRLDAVRESSIAMLLPLAALALACVVMGIAAPYVLPMLKGAIDTLAPSSASHSALLLQLAASTLTHVVLVALALIACVCLLVLLRRCLLSRREVVRTVTWDCGYAAPAPRMQYTASSFAAPLTSVFSLLLSMKSHFGGLSSVFPSSATFSSHANDVARHGFFEPVFRAISRTLMRTRIIQHGNIHLYILYIAIALLALLAWAFGGL